MNWMLVKFHCACTPGARRQFCPLPLGLHTPPRRTCFLQSAVLLGATHALSRYGLHMTDRACLGRLSTYACLTLVLPIRWLYSWPSMCVHCCRFVYVFVRPNMQPHNMSSLPRCVWQLDLRVRRSVPTLRSSPNPFVFVVSVVCFSVVLFNATRCNFVMYFMQLLHALQFTSVAQVLELCRNCV